MAKIPKNLQNDALSDCLQKNGFTRIHQGKVRDTYTLDENRSELLVVATDRISIFDFVLNALVPKKGEVLTALTHFWLTNVLKEFNNHLSESIVKNSFSSKHGAKFNGAYMLNRAYCSELPIERCLTVKNLSETMYPFELIFRYFIGGSVYGNYLETGRAGGHTLPPNLPKWSKLDEPIFTPSTKEEVGHDINVDCDYFHKRLYSLNAYSRESYHVVDTLIKAYKKAFAFAESKGIYIIDTKFETARIIIADEVLTPDSSRFVYIEDWKQSMKEGKDPKFLDKQPVRDWGSQIETPFKKDGVKIIGINKLDPENPEHVDFVHSLTVPEKIIDDTTKRYVDLFKLLTGVDLKTYQVNELGC